MARPRKLSPIALEFMRWELTDPDERDPKTQTEWCAAYDQPDSNPSRWKRSPSWAVALANLQDDVPDEEDGALQGVLDALRAVAMSGDVAAMTAYVRHATALEEPDDADVRGMTDLELADALLAASLEVRSRV